MVSLRGRGNKQTLVYNLSSPCICLMYLVHVFKGYLSSSAATMSSWDPCVLKVLIDVFQDMYSRERFTSEKTLVPLILRTRLLVSMSKKPPSSRKCVCSELGPPEKFHTWRFSSVKCLEEIIVYSERALPPGFVLEKLDRYFPKPTDAVWNKFAETYHLKGKSVAWLLDTCKKSRQYVMNLVVKKRRVENDLGDVQGFVVTVKRLADQIAVDISNTIPQTGLEKILAGEKLQLDKDTEQIIQTVIHADRPITEKHLLQLLELQETMEHPPVELNALMENL
ncbi:hypothetical protein HPB48_021587 [Haemaphysalis longicornis]|uniref:Uncharacterized protein n=1 Tax=Haemaphysalis longicornis TaxID=44386 RepID=A0A9J6FCH5_HAELO|nr:hypothetical protein HPB48_021587 [Haemaphysalis longicornis]